MDTFGELFSQCVFDDTAHVVPCNRGEKEKTQKFSLEWVRTLVEADKTQFTVQDLKFFSFVTDILRLGQSNI